MSAVWSGLIFVASVAVAVYVVIYGVVWVSGLAGLVILRRVTNEQ